MSGHNKWSTIKHKKGAIDAKRSRLWTKLVKEITVAARIGGGDPNGNPRLRKAIDLGKAGNMPNDNIERAIKKGTGEIEGVNYEELLYEGYGPGGAAVIIEAMTDNRNRTVGEIRKIFERHNGNMGAGGSVAWMFKKRGVLSFEKNGLDEDALMEAALDAGADDVADQGESMDVVTEPGAFDGVKEALEKKGLKPTNAEVTMVPQNTVRLEGNQAESMVKLMSALDDHDDVQNVYGNADIDDDVYERVAS
jgi:YebC/PmpR family DNA-binding regulatory protein